MIGSLPMLHSSVAVRGSSCSQLLSSGLVHRSQLTFLRLLGIAVVVLRLHFVGAGSPPPEAGRPAGVRTSRSGYADNWRKPAPTSAIRLKRWLCSTSKSGDKVSEACSQAPFQRKRRTGTSQWGSSASL